MGSYLGLVRGHARPLASGLILMALSSFGQTFFIALFNPQIAAANHLSPASLGTAYAGATIGSALTLRHVGAWLDRMSVRRYAAGVAIVLGTACLLMGVGQGIIALVLAFYGLRLGGQGLMVHTALTATARRFHEARGKALGLVSLGLSAGEAVLPGIAIGLSAVIGWRNVWIAAGAAAVAGTAAAIVLLPPRRGPREPSPHRTTHRKAGLWRDPRIVFTMPAILASPFLLTGIFFEQTALLAEKHWPLGFWASMFVGYAIMRATSMLLIGPVIDRIGAVRLLPVFTVPLAFCMATIAFISGKWGVAAFLLAAGLSNGITTTLITALWAELFGPERLGEIRASVDSASVLATALAPMAMGALIGVGIPLADQALPALVYVGASTALAGWFGRRHGRMAAA